MQINLANATVASINASLSSDDQARLGFDLGVEAVDGCIFKGLVCAGRAETVDDALTIVAQYVASTPRYRTLLDTYCSHNNDRKNERFGPPDLEPGRTPTKR